MPNQNLPPLPSDDLGDGSLHMIDPTTGKQVSVGDMRAEFERLSRQVPRDLEAEQAFIESKIDMIRNEPTLNEEQRALAIKQLRRAVA